MHGSLPLVSALADACYELASQLRSGSVSVHNFLTPLVSEGHQKAPAQLTQTPLQGSDLCWGLSVFPPLNYSKKEEIEIRLRLFPLKNEEMRSLFGRGSIRFSFPDVAKEC